MTETDAERKPFTPISEDGIPFWKKIYEAVGEQPVGTIFTYTELGNVIDHNLTESRSCIYEANKHLLRKKNIMLINVRNKGYKIAEATEQLEHATDRPKRAKRQLKKGLREAEHTNTKTLSTEEKKQRVDLITHMQIGMKTLRKRQHKAIEKQKKALKEQKMAEKQIDEMMDRLKVMKQTITQS